MANIRSHRPFQACILSIAEALHATYVNPLDQATSTLQETRSTNIRYLFETGIHACNEWQRYDNVRIACVTDSSAKTFWAIVKEELRLKDSWSAPASDVLDLSDDGLAAGQDVHEAVAEIGRLCRQQEMRCRFYLHYAKMPTGFTISPTRDRLCQILHAQALDKNLALVYDTQAIAYFFSREYLDPRNFLPASCRRAYRSLRHWFRAHGLFGPEYGFLDSLTFLWLTSRAYMHYAIEKAHPSCDGSELLIYAFHYLKVTVRDSAGGQTLTPELWSPSGRLSLTHMTPEAIRIVHHVLQETKDSLSLLEESDGDHVKSFERGWESFRNSHEVCLRITGETWAQSPSREGELYQSLIDIVLSFSKYIATYKNQDEVLVPWIWPEPLWREGQDQQTRVFVIGFQSKSNLDAKQTSRMGRRLRYRLERTLSQPAVQVPPWDNDKDAVLVPEGLTVTTEFIPGYSLYDHIPPSTFDARRQSLKIKAVQPASSPAASASSSTRFRTASQAIARLRHDPAHAGIAYDVGYEDRFEGLKWMALEDWGGKASEEEDFIPEHRVRALRRREGGDVVWDREKRVDATGG